MRPPLLLFYFAAFLIGAFAPTLVAAPVHEVVASFPLEPLSPGSGTLVPGPDGKLWGTTTHGGAYGMGTLYSINPETGDWRIRMSFTGNRTFDRGAWPEGELHNDGNGYLWGTTQKGGTSGFGTVFKYHVATGVLTTLVDFTNRQGEKKGADAVGRLTADGAGHLWGVTTYGGNAEGFGTVFKVDTTTGEHVTVVEFSATGPENEGALPLAGLVRDESGQLWGTTSEGGSAGHGTIFKINPASGTLTTVLHFTPGTDAEMGAAPAGELVSDGEGYLWGTTPYGGDEGYGTIFKLNISTGELTTVVSLKGVFGTVNKGAYPYGALVSDGAGSFWGTTADGGISHNGTVFKVNRATGTLTTMFQFRSNSTTGNTGTDPEAGLYFDGVDTMWGTTGQGHQFGTDSVFKINTTTGAFATVTYFAANETANRGVAPAGGLVGDGKGYLWGTTEAGGERRLGTVFKVHQISGEITTVAEFGVNGVRGFAPIAELVPDGLGYFWGSTRMGGTGTYGTIYKINEATGEFTTVVDFGNTGPIAGASPYGRLFYDGNGTFWGTTLSGGHDSGGTIFKLNRATGALTTVSNFRVNRTPVNGDQPFAGLVSDGMGNLWGTTPQNGSTAYGTVYKVKMSTGIVTKVVQFMVAETDGSHPWAALAPDGAGSFIGTTHRGGTLSFGTVFKVNALSGDLTKLADFTSNGETNRGANPWAALVGDGTGWMFGTTNGGGSNGLGTVFRVHSTTGVLETLVDFSGAGPQYGSGGRPGYGALLRHSDGNLYGTTASGGMGGGGTVFRLRYGPTPVTIAATDVAKTTARLTGTVNPNGTVSDATFEWGTDPTLSVWQTTAAVIMTPGTSPQAYSVDLTGLKGNTRYYYRARASNSDNALPQYGFIQSFTTEEDPDSDGDGLPDEWEIAQFGEVTQSDALGDSDKDGVTALHEYAFSMNPKVPDSHVVPLPRLVDGFLTITLPKRMRVTYVVETAGALVPQSWSTETTEIVSETAATVTVRDTVPSTEEGSRFLRVRVTAP